jgi:hypothetical protein
MIHLQEGCGIILQNGCEFAKSHQEIMHVVITI